MPHERSWRVWILLASYVFYGWWDWRFVFLLGAATGVNHVLAGGVYRARGGRRGLLRLSLAFALRLLRYFKYTNFFLTPGAHVVRESGVADVVLPVGISLFPF